MRNPFRRCRVPACQVGIALLLAFGATAAQAGDAPVAQAAPSTPDDVANLKQPFMLVNNVSGTSVTVCGAVNINASVPSLFGKWTYNWKLFINGTEAPLTGSTSKTSSCFAIPAAACPPIYFSGAPATPTSGHYQLQLHADSDTFNDKTALSNTISVTTAPYATAAPKINGSSAVNVDVHANGPITLNGTSPCASGYFLSVQLSDLWWTRYGPEAMRWLSAADFAKYGPISNFDVKRFAEDQWFHFSVGQYYRVKLAVGSPWNEKTQLVRVIP